MDQTEQYLCAGSAQKTEIDVGAYKWLTVVSQEEQAGTELVLEPNANPLAKEYQTALYGQGILLTAFKVEDVRETFE